LAAEVNLSLQAPASANRGDIVPVMLIADADTTGVDVCTVEVILNWDSEVLRLIGVDTGGAFPWSVSDFLSSPLNSSLPGAPEEDGDAIYTALTIAPAMVDDLGVLVTTFEFEVLVGTQFSDIEIVNSSGMEETSVFLCSPPGMPATLGTVSNTTIKQVPTVTEWGLIIMTAMGMFAGAYAFRRAPA
jgi:hypothetical protein